MIKLHENGEPRRFVRPMAEIIEMSHDVIATSIDPDTPDPAQGFDSPEDAFENVVDNYQQ